MSTLSNKVAIITGGVGGLGRAMVELFVDRGARVLIADLDEQRGSALQAAMGDAAIFHATDVSDAKHLQAAINRAVKEFGGLDIMVNNAAIKSAMHTRLLDEDFADFQGVMQVNLLGVMLGTQLAAKHMVSKGSGSIINISAISGISAGFGLPCYRAAKAAVCHFSKSAAIDLGASGVRVNCIAPGNIPTEMNAFVDPDMNEQQLRRWDEIRTGVRMAPQPLKREGSPRDIAEAAAFLGSDQAAQISGIVLPVDGGITIGALGNPLPALNAPDYSLTF